MKEKMKNTDIMLVSGILKQCFNKYRLLNVPQKNTRHHMLGGTLPNTNVGMSGRDVLENSMTERWIGKKDFA